MVITLMITRALVRDPSFEEPQPRPRAQAVAAAVAVCRPQPKLLWELLLLQVLQSICATGPSLEVVAAVSQAARAAAADQGADQGAAASPNFAAALRSQVRL